VRSLGPPAAAVHAASVRSCGSVAVFGSSSSSSSYWTTRGKGAAGKQLDDVAHAVSPLALGTIWMVLKLTPTILASVWVFGKLCSGKALSTSFGLHGPL
jgi:hypothetical protein